MIRSRVLNSIVKTGLFFCRVTELESSLTQIEAYNKEREVRDEAIKNQQNKLIHFLQSKIDGKKKKVCLSNL